ncbi:unnamed protein product [Gordionus sp. m RMFG-2023]|uniref:mitochondrial import inner membrane translocase subunit Tim21-like n=1 Tax=Gordionus sp. m RMFG-2023 TaxID=3053472 RepID=UPI0030E1269A
MSKNNIYLYSVCKQILKHSPSLKEHTIYATISTSNIFNERQIKIVENKSSQVPQKFMGERIKETTKNISYLGIILVGFGVTGFLFYIIGKELFSSNTPTSIFSKAFKIIKTNNQVTDLLGSPLKAFGEDSGRGRRRFINHEIYRTTDGNQYMRIKFYISGNDSLRKGTVYVESLYNPTTKNYEFNKILVKIGGGYGEKIIQVL